VAQKKQNGKDSRQARERLRVYNARVTVHERAHKRRVRDNVIASVGVLVIVVLAVTAQLTFFSSKSTSSSKPSASATPTPTTASGVPSSALAEGRTWTGTMTINGIPLNFELDGKDAPQAVSSTISLINKGFYNGNVCHRLTTGATFKVLQCGDPNGDGTGGPGYSYGPIENAPADNVYPSGTIAMARQSGNASSQGSQFFIVYGDTTIPSDSAGGYTVIGKITSDLGELKSKVTDAGVAGGGTDGKPAVTPKIDSITIK
jgi:peptidyl-prolyl cis-trans isomerase B (cyclophilin B)